MSTLHLLSGWQTDILARGKEILSQIQDGDVTMMRVFGKQIQHPFVVPALLHQIFQDQHPSLGWVPSVQVGGLGKSFVKVDAPFLQGFESRLPCPVAIMKGTRCRLNRFSKFSMVLLVLNDENELGHAPF